MDISKNQWIIGCVVVVVAIGLGFFARNYFSKMPATNPATNPLTIASSTQPTATSSTPVTTTTTGTAVTPFPISPSDHITSWTFTEGAAQDPTLISQTNADKTHLTSLLGKGQYDDYDLCNGIANDDTLLGDGADAYQNYNRAIAIHPTKGLAYANLGHLFDELGAYNSAAAAYAKAVAVEPSDMQFDLQRLDFLTTKLPNDTTAILAAFTDASNQFGDAAPVLSIEAQWLTEQGRYADAITAWQKVEALSPGQDNSSIDAAIARLKAKE